MSKLQVFLTDDNKVTHDLVEDRITIGRLPDNDIQIEDDSVSSHHAELVAVDGSYRLRDLASTNGTYVDEDPITDLVLASRVDIRFGGVEALFTSEVAHGETAQPLPDLPIKAAAAAALSARPESFVSTSPVPRNRKEKDPIGTAMVGLAALAMLTTIAAAYFVFFSVV